MLQKTIAVDMGNTNTRIGLIDCVRMQCLWHASIPTADAPDALPAAIQSLLNENTQLPPLVVKICSVVSFPEKELTSRLSHIPNLQRIYCCAYSQEIPLHISYANPASLGLDRIANCLYAVRQYPGANCIIIDGGTAITIDALTKDRRFLGGYIFPGAAAQLRSLHSHTSRLPLVTTIGDSIPFPPDSTNAAMTGGVCFGLAGAIPYLIKKMSALFDDDFIAIACGGGWKTIEPYVDFQVQYIPELTLIGIGLFGEK